MESHHKVMEQLKSDRDVRHLSHNIRKLNIAELHSKLRELKVSTEGETELLQDRLLRALLLQEGQSENIPWYDWDNGGQIPQQSQEALLDKPKAKKSKSKKSRKAEAQRDPITGITASEIGLTSQSEAEIEAETLDEVINSSVEQIQSLTTRQPEIGATSTALQISMTNQLKKLVSSQVLGALGNP